MEVFILTVSFMLNKNVLDNGFFLVDIISIVTEVRTQQELNALKLVMEIFIVNHRIRELVQSS